MRYFIFFVTALAAGCATIVNGTSQDIEVVTNPAGAKVYVDGE